MSHFSARVLIPKEILRSNSPSFKDHQDKLYKAIMDLIFPYSAKFPDTEYQVPCSCLPHEVRSTAIENANKEVGEFWELYQLFLQIPDDNGPDFSEYTPFKKWEKTCKKAIKQHHQYKDRDIKCKFCNGDGFRKTEENYSCCKYVYCNIFELDPAGEQGLDLDLFINVSDIEYLDLDIPVIVTTDGRWHNINWTISYDDPVHEWRERSQSILMDYKNHVAFKADMSIEKLELITNEYRKQMHL